MAETGTIDTSRQGISFYGWRVVGAVFVMLMVSSGLGFYNLSVFIEALSRHGQFSVATASNAASLFFLIGAGSGLVIGKLIDRYDPRYTICIGAVLAAAGMLAIGRADTPALLFASFTLFAVGFSCTSLIPGTTLVARWFSRRRAIALSVASSGLSVGGIALTPFAAALIDKLGLAGATPWLALIYVLGVIPVAAFYLRKSPESMGLEPDGVQTASTGSKIHLAGTTFSGALRSRFFIFCTVAFVFILMAQVGGLAHQFNLVAERINTTIAATAVASLAGASLIGRFIGGWAISRFSIRPVTLVLIFVQASSLFAIAFADTTFALLAASIVLGLALGNLLMALPLLLADAFGMRDYGRIYATSQAIAQMGVAIGPALVGFLYGAWNGYTVAIIATSCLALAGAVAFLMAGPVPSPAQN